MVLKYNYEGYLVLVFKEPGTLGESGTLGISAGLHVKTLTEIHLALGTAFRPHKLSLNVIPG